MIDSFKKCIIFQIQNLQLTLSSTLTCTQKTKWTQRHKREQSCQVCFNDSDDLSLVAIHLPVNFLGYLVVKKKKFIALGLALITPAPLSTCYQIRFYSTYSIPKIYFVVSIVQICSKLNISHCNLIMLTLTKISLIDSPAFLDCNAEDPLMHTKACNKVSFTIRNNE